MTTTYPPAQASDEPMRAAFEAWACPTVAQGNGAQHDLTGWYYFDESTQDRWEAWQAAIHQSSGNSGELAPRATADVERLESLLAAEKRKTLELQRVHDERGMQIDRLETALYRAALKAQPAPTEAPVVYQQRMIAPNGNAGVWHETPAAMYERYSANQDIGDGFKYEVRALYAGRPAPTDPLQQLVDQAQELDMGYGKGEDAREWISVADRLPPAGVLVMVWKPCQEWNYPDDFLISFDCIDPEDDDGATWQGHNNWYEEYCIIGKPEGSTGPSQNAPYTHWMPLPAAPTIPAIPGTKEKP